ncbi:MAG: ISLre2 family transposase [Bacillota bacterium]
MWLIREIVEIVLFVVQEVYKLLTGSPDLEALEVGVYRVMNEATRRLLEAACRNLDERLLEQRDKRRLRSVHTRARTVLTPFGELRIERRYYVDREGGRGRYLLDEVLGLEPRQRLSPWLRKVAVALAAEMPYRRAAEVLRVVTLENVDIRGMTLWQEVQEAGAELRRRAVKGQRKVFEEGELPAGGRRARRLYVEADEVWVRGRGQQRHVGIKLAVGYEGKAEVAPGRRLLEQRRVHAGVVSGAEFWDECVAEFGQHWDLGAVEEYEIGGDGAAWVKAGCEHFPGARYRLDPFHLRRALLEGLSHDEGAYQAVCEGLAAGDWGEVDRALRGAQGRSRGAERRRVVALRRYLQANWEGIRATDAGERLGAIEGQVFHHLARRMKRQGARWSDAGADHLARVLAVRANGELQAVVRPRRQAQPEGVQRLLRDRRLIAELERGQDPEEWLRARVPALYGPGAGSPWVRYVLRQLAHILPQIA